MIDEKKEKADVGKKTVQAKTDTEKAKASTDVPEKKT